MRVGDFGLARDIYLTNYYRAPSEAKLPVKWMPPEMLQDGVSDEKSDVVSGRGIALNVVSGRGILLDVVSGKDIVLSVLVTIKHPRFLTDFLKLIN